MGKRYYIAYGSNLNVSQMHWRCPTAKVMGTAVIEDYELLFKGSKTGSYLTIEPKKGYRVPVVAWSVEKKDELALDRYEGYPDFYYKKEFTLPIKGIKTGKVRERKAFAYIMHGNRPIGIPSQHYLEICLAGYHLFKFNKDILFDAYKQSVRRAE